MVDAVEPAVPVSGSNCSVCGKPHEGSKSTPVLHVFHPEDVDAEFLDRWDDEGGLVVDDAAAYSLYADVSEELAEGTFQAAVENWPDE